ncbi:MULTISPECIES: hypothetical protein [Bacillaceae]|uniref:hypothetical protein n=1 Tax=Bacillaceae TaxID=186817 RepID=UPI000BFC3CE6|nr:MULTISPECIES: hypothetical protein [Bacillaceae]PGT81335.1 hypothetical protein COD11_17995 [Bacillus sp. AFS040349]UGB32860.1 hypothetical protein LPC09_10715 [Metabacillus sp. B2-18]
MAFGISRSELTRWKEEVEKGEISFLTHFWLDERFPTIHCVTKVGCSDINKLKNWGASFGLKKEWIHFYKEYPHFDIMGETQLRILKHYGLNDHIVRFKLS